MQLFDFSRLRVDALLLFVITVASSALSAFCGWQIASGTHTAIQLVSAASFACIAVILSQNVYAAALAYGHRDRQEARRLVKYCLVLAAFNWLTDFGAASVIRDFTNVATQNTNIAAAQKLGEVKRIEGELGEINAKIAKHAGLEGPDYWRAEIRGLKTVLGVDARNIWQRSKQCADVTLRESREHCAEITKAEQGLARAIDVQSMKARRLALTAALPAAKQASQQKQETSNPVVAQISNFVAMARLTFEPAPGEIKWGLLIFTATYTGVFSLVIFLQSWNAGLRDVRAGAVSANFPAQNTILTDDRPIAPEATMQGAVHYQTTTDRRQRELDAIKAMELAIQRARGLA
jgi:hypothetical protein